MITPPSVHVTPPRSSRHPVARSAAAPGSVAAKVKAVENGGSVKVARETSAGQGPRLSDIAKSVCSSPYSALDSSMVPDCEKLLNEEWWFQHLEDRRRGGAPPDTFVFACLGAGTESQQASLPAPPASASSEWWFQHLEERRRGGAPPDTFVFDCPCGGGHLPDALVASSGRA